MKKLIYSVLFVVATLFMACGEQPVATFTNPLLPHGPDPWAIWHDGYYYYMHTTQNNLQVWKTKDVTDDSCVCDTCCACTHQYLALREVSLNEF